MVGEGECFRSCQTNPFPSSEVAITDTIDSQRANGIVPAIWNSLAPHQEVCRVPHWTSHDCEVARPAIIFVKGESIALWDHDGRYSVAADIQILHV